MVIRLSDNGSRIDSATSARARAMGEFATGFYPDMDWQRIEPQMASDWNRVRGASGWSWNDVRDEAHAAWQVARLSRSSEQCDNAPVKMPNAA